VLHVPYKRKKEERRKEEEEKTGYMDLAVRPFRRSLTLLRPLPFLHIPSAYVHSWLLFSFPNPVKSSPRETRREGRGIETAIIGIKKMYKRRISLHYFPLPNPILFRLDVRYGVALARLSSQSSQSST